MRRHLRPAASVGAGLLTLTLVAALTGPAAATPEDDSADWLGRQLTDGLVHNDQYGVDDYGLTADTAFALKAAGGHAGALADIREALEANVGWWTSGGDPAEAYAGSFAKALVLAQVTGGGAEDFGGVDLVAGLEGVTRDDGPVGRVQDQSQYGDYANSFAQTFAARGLARAGSPEAAGAIRFLLKQQCDAGFFRLNFATVDAAKQGCDAGTAEESPPDTDVTALAVINLKALPKAARTPATKRAIADAVAWLKRSQKRNGSHGGGASTEASNTNSTGLAAWALGISGSCVKARKAARWVRGLQVSGDVSGTPLEGEVGAIAYDRAGYAAAAEEGIGVEQRDQWRRATTQAAPGLAFLACP